MLRRKSLLDILSTGNGPRLAIAALLFWTTAIEPVIAQTSSPPAQQTPSSEAEQAAPHYSMEDLSYLLEPIALYPDPLLALILSASTFPVQIVEAERWTASNPISVRRGNFSEVDAMDWDSSVKALARFPDVIRKLADHLDWTESLGIAVATQTSDVTAAIQLLRAKAESLGNLQSTPEQTVTTRDEGGSRVIYVLPANPEKIYVPVYDPGIVFSSSAAGAIAVSACWLAQPGIAAGAGIIADGIKSGSLRQRGIPRLPLGGRRIAQGADHRDPGDRIARAAIDLNAPAAGRNVLADLVVVPKFRVFGRSVLVADPKARTFGRSVLAGPVVVPKLRTFGRSVLVADPRAQTFGRGVLVVHNDPATPLAPAAGIITSLVRVRIIRRDNNPAMQLARVEGIGSILARARISRRDNNRSTRRGLGRQRRRAPEHSPPRDKETRASAIALREADDLARSENARCETFVSGTLLEPLVAHVRLHYFRHSRSVRGHWSRIIPGRLTSQK